MISSWFINPLRSVNLWLAGNSTNAVALALSVIFCGLVGHATGQQKRQQKKESTAKKATKKIS
jgi:hypothetical protein